MSRKSVEEIIKQEYNKLINILDGKYGLSPEDKEVIEEAFHIGFDRGWKICIERSYETYED